MIRISRSLTSMPLNAALAVIRWKRLMGYYVDQQGEHQSRYTIDAERQEQRGVLMAKLNRITHRFVERVPSPLEDGVVYVSVGSGPSFTSVAVGAATKLSHR